MRLFVSGGTHIHWDSGSREEEIEDALGGKPDVVFVENRGEPDNRREKWLNLIAAPLTLLCIIIWFLSLNLLRVPFSSDQKIAQSFSNKRNVDRINVDVSITQMISDGRPLWAMANWISIAIAGLISITSGGVYFFGWAAIFAFLLFFAFVGGTAGLRNYVMAMKTLQETTKNDFERGVLIVGNAHVDPIEKQLEEAGDIVEIVQAEG